MLKKIREPRNIEEKKCYHCWGTGRVKVTSHINKKVVHRKCPHCTEKWIPEPDDVITPIPPDDNLTPDEKKTVKERKKPGIFRKITSFTEDITGKIIAAIFLIPFIILFIIITPLSYPFFTILFSVFPPDELAIEQAVFELTNEERQSPLSYNEDLHSIAKEHSKDMVERGYFSHYTPEGLSPTDRARMKNISVIKYLGTSGNTNYYAEGIAENLIETSLGVYQWVSFENPETGYTTPTELRCFLVLTSKQIAKCAVEGWKDSPGHYGNIINPDYDEIGVGVYCRYDECRITQNFR